ncbi:MAG TPA: hypothetical protein VEU96_09735 [Bryobacteraceae bacterium]|nr:hypothetical protein [Bryobacteraceae bacterium]
MMRRNLCSITALLLALLPLGAADLSGKWSGTVSVPDQTLQVTLILKVDGASLRGSFGPSEDQQSPIESGRVEGSKMTFQVTGPHGGVLHFELRVEEDTLKGAMTRTMGNETEHGTVELKRAR